MKSEPASSQSFKFFNFRRGELHITEKAPAPELPKAWREIATVEKEPIGWPEWPMPEAPPVPRGRTPPGELRSTAGNRIEVVIPLAKVGGQASKVPASAFVLTRIVENGR